MVALAAAAAAAPAATANINVNIAMIGGQVAATTYYNIRSMRLRHTGIGSCRQIGCNLMSSHEMLAGLAGALKKEIQHTPTTSLLPYGTGGCKVLSGHNY